MSLGRDEKGRFNEDNDEQSYTVEEIIAFAKDYIKHIESGFTKKSFVPCDYRTLEKHLQNNPELRPIKRLVQQAFRKNMMFWEERGMKGLMVGKRFNSVTWIFNMKNRFKEDWMDKQVRENADTLNAKIEHTGTIRVKFGGGTVHPSQESGDNTPVD